MSKKEGIDMAGRLLLYSLKDDSLVLDIPIESYTLECDRGTERNNILLTIKEDYNMRKEFEMTKGQFDKIIEASKPVPYMVFGDRPPASPQENANAAWSDLGDELGFDYLTVRPVSGKGMYFFTAEQK